MRDINNIKNYNQPLLFYFWATFISWLCWFAAAYLSHKGDGESIDHVLSGILMLVGLVSPTCVAFLMMAFHKNLKNDFWPRIFQFSHIKPIYIFWAFCLMPLSILGAQGISLVFGYSVDQFQFSQHTSFTFSLFPAWILLFLAPAIEEMAWHSYGTDCLRAKFNLFITSVIFSIFWVVWHLPLSFIQGYYHSNIVEISWIYFLNFAISLFPFVLLMNWLYYKSHRSTLLAIIFHVTAGVFNEIFATHPDSKIIQTLLLTAGVIFVMSKEKEMFFQKKLRF